MQVDGEGGRTSERFLLKGLSCSTQVRLHTWDHLPSGALSEKPACVLWKELPCAAGRSEESWGPVKREGPFAGENAICCYPGSCSLPTKRVAATHHLLEMAFHTEPGTLFYTVTLPCKLFCSMGIFNLACRQFVGCCHLQGLLPSLFHTDGRI